MITRRDIEQYVVDTLPWTELDDWDCGGIVDDMLVLWPGLIGLCDVDADTHLGPNRVIDNYIDGGRYWQIVRGNYIEADV